VREAVAAARMVAGLIWFIKRCARGCEAKVYSLIMQHPVWRR
jgi:hypothetical protein